MYRMQELYTNYCRRWQEELKDELEQNKRQTKSLKRSLVRVLHNVIDLQKSTQKTHSFPLPTYHLQVIQGNLKKALAMTDKPMKVNSECQQYRKSRTGELQIFLHLDERLFRH